MNTSPLRHEPRPGSAVVLVSTGETRDGNTLSCESDKEADLYAHQLGYLPVFASPAIPDLHVVSEYFYGCISCVLSLYYLAVREALSASGQGDPYEACALLGLVKKTKDTPALDMTQACRRCVRAVRVQSAT